MRVFILLVTLSSCRAEVVQASERIVQGFSLPQNRTVFPEVVSNNVTGRSLLDLPHQTILPFAIRQLGVIECQGVDHTFGGNFFERVMGPGADAGGNYLCKPTCDGECVVTQGLGEAPISIYYPFGCRCNPNRCGPNGPVVSDLVQGRAPIFKVICVPDERCTCASMGRQGSLRGYLCNWINLNTDRPISFLDRPPRPHMPPTLSPIRWCSCCPS